MTGCGKGCAVAALGVLSCIPAMLPNSSFLKTQGAVPRPHGAGSGRDSGSRAGCWRAGTHPSMWEAHREGEGREGRPRREAKQGVASGSLITHYWKHLAWDVGVCTGCTHVCTCAWVWGNTHICIYGYILINTRTHTCVHACSHVLTYPYMGTYVPICVQTHIHWHGGLHTHVGAHIHGCKHVQLRVYTLLTTQG